VAQAIAKLTAMDNLLIRFSIAADSLAWPVTVSLRQGSGGWIAQVEGAGWPAGIGPSARAALEAALAPLGRRAIRSALADVAMLEPSLRVLEAQRRAG
jgi:hypothetical protein